VGHGTFAVVVEAIRNITKEGTRANGSLPGGFVNGELLERLHVDDNAVILSADAVVRIRVPARPRLHFQVVIDSTFHNLRNLIGSLWVSDGGWCDRYIQVVGLDVLYLEERSIFEGDITPANSAFEALLDWRTGTVSHGAGRFLNRRKKRFATYNQE
jgi:hypothetical protein